MSESPGRKLLAKLKRDCTCGAAQGRLARGVLICPQCEAADTIERLLKEREGSERVIEGINAELTEQFELSTKYVAEWSRLLALLGEVAEALAPVHRASPLFNDLMPRWARPASALYERVKGELAVSQSQPIATSVPSPSAEAEPSAEREP